MKHKIIILLLLILSSINVSRAGNDPGFLPVGVTRVDKVSDTIVVTSQSQGHTTTKILIMSRNEKYTKELHFKEFLIQADDGRVFGFVKGVQDTAYSFVSAASFKEYQDKGPTYLLQPGKTVFVFNSKGSPVSDETFAIALRMGFEKIDLLKLPLTIDPPSLDDQRYCGGCTPAEASRDCWEAATSACAGNVSDVCYDSNCNSEGCYGVITYTCDRTFRP